MFSMCYFILQEEIRTKASKASRKARKSFSKYSNVVIQQAKYEILSFYGQEHNFQRSIFSSQFPSIDLRYGGRKSEFETQETTSISPESFKPCSTKEVNKSIVMEIFYDPMRFSLRVEFLQNKDRWRDMYYDPYFIEFYNLSTRTSFLWLISHVMGRHMFLKKPSKDILNVWRTTYEIL